MKAKEDGKPKCQSSSCWLSNCPYLNTPSPVCPLPPHISLHLSRTASSLSSARCCSWLLGTSLLYNTNKNVTYPSEINANFVHFSRRDPCPRLAPYAECPAVSVRSSGSAGKLLDDWMGKYKLDSYWGEKPQPVYKKDKDKFLYVSENNHWIIGTGLHSSNISCSSGSSKLTSSSPRTVVICNPANVSGGASPVGLTGWKYFSENVNDTRDGFRIDSQLKVEMSPGICGYTVWGEKHCCRLTREEAWEWDFRVRGRCMVLRPPKITHSALEQNETKIYNEAHEYPTEQIPTEVKVGYSIIGITIVFVICYQLVTRTLDERRYRSL